MSIRIHMIRTRYPHWGEHSGIFQYVKHLDHKEFVIDMCLVPDSDADFPIKNQISRGVVRYVLQKRGMEWYKLSDLTAELRALSSCRHNQIDIVHYLDGEHTAQFLPCMLKIIRKARPKIVATYHQPPELLDSLIRRDVIKRLDCVIAVSPDQAAYFSDRVGATNVKMILHGVDTDYFTLGNQENKKKKFKCITVGHWLRDFETFRNVAERLKDNCLVEFDIVSSQVSEMTDLPNVYIHKDIEDAKLLELYQEADLLFLPLTKCTANNALLEGIACGLPVVSTSIPAVKAYVPGQEALLVENNDPKRFAEAILYLSSNQRYRIKMARRARKRAEQLDWRNIVAQYENVYSELVNEF
jgi:glycosyltransferase involved in cell wall biosynthesis